MRIKYTPQAIQDLQEIRGYISSALHNPKAAQRISKMILDSCAHLKEFPQSGVSMSAKLQVESSERILFCENYIAVYRVDDEYISVARILDARQDYVKILFGSKK